MEPTDGIFASLLGGEGVWYLVIVDAGCCGGANGGCPCVALGRGATLLHDYVSSGPDKDADSVRLRPLPLAR